jgi:hypothetical protein
MYRMILLFCLVFILRDAEGQNNPPLSLTNRIGLVWITYTPSAQYAITYREGDFGNLQAFTYSMITYA